MQSTMKVFLFHAFVLKTCVRTLQYVVRYDMMFVMNIDKYYYDADIYIYISIKIIL